MESQLTPRDLLKARLANVRAWLNSALKRITPELAGWSPAPTARTFAGQLVEIIAVEAPLVPRLRDGHDLTDPELEAMIGDLTNLDDLKNALIKVRQETLDYLDSLSEEELSEVIPSGECWFGTMWLPEMPRAQHFLNIAEHEYYHVGQLYTYFWASGDDPYKW